MNEYKPPYTITSKILKLTAAISEAAGKLEALEPKIVTPKLRKKNRIRTITGTLEIEGNTLGFEKVTALLEGKRVLGSVREVTEVEGAIKVYDEFENWKFDNLDDLLKAHNLLMNKILTRPGEFRQKAVGVHSGEKVVHVAPPFARVPILMQDLFEWLKNTDEHPLIVSSIFHYEFEYIHPFSDGNGRIGRLWQSVILYNWKPFFSYVPLEGIVRDNQQAYYQALLDAGTAGESTPFIEFMLRSILEAITDVAENVPNHVPDNVPNDRGDLILHSIKENTNISVKDLASKYDVNEKTIKRDIEKLKQNGKITRVGSARSGHWEIV